jgi:MFS family permease
VSLWAGALADAADRRRIMLAAELVAACATAVLLANSMLASPRVWILFAMAVVASVGYALMRPAYDAAIPRLADRSEYRAVASIEGLLGSAAMIGGPAIAGLVLAFSGATLAYWVDLATFGVMLGVALALRPIPASEDAERPSLRAIGAALRYAARRQVLLGTYVVDEVAMVFGMPMAVFPALALHRFGSGGGALGLLYTAPAAGAAVASATSGWTARVHRHGLAVLVAAAAWGVAIVLFGFAHSLLPALVALAFAGGADMVSGVFRMTIWNEVVPDHMRGRLAGVELLNYSSGPALGNVEAGAVATVTTPTFAVVSGGLLCVVGVAVVAIALPGLARYDRRRESAGQ